MFCLLLSVFCCLSSAPAHAACTNPAGGAGKITYNTTHNVVQYCDGDNWVGFGLANSGAGSGGCTGPAGVEGQLTFNQSESVLQFCNGENWIAVADRSPVSSLPPTPYAYWSFEDGTGSATLSDEIGSNDGTLNNMDTANDWVSGRSGTALEFDGTDDYVQMPVDALKFTSSFTYATWIYADGAGTSDYPLNWRSNQNGGTYGIYIGTSENELRCYTETSAGSHISASIPGGVNGAWFHVACVVDVVADTLKIYVNGSEEGSRTLDNISYPDPPWTPRALIFGARGDGIDHFPGKIDEVAIYDRALTVEEIQDLMSATEQFPAGADISTGLIHHWTLDEATGVAPVDSAGSANGTINGDPQSIDGVINGALDFDGAGDYIQMGDIADIRGVSELTLAAWMKRRASGDLVMIGKQESGGDNSLEIEVWSDGTVYCAVSQSSGFAAGSFPYSNSDLDWHHVTMVFDGNQSGNDRIQCYLDGRAQSLSYSGTIPATTTNATNDFAIGKLQSTVSDGFIDDVRIYDRALSADDVFALARGCENPRAPAGSVTFNAGPEPTSGLVGHWKLDETSGSSIADSAGSNNGTWTDGDNNDVTEEATGGRVDGAIDFDSAGRYVYWTDTNALESLSNLSIGFWLKPYSHDEKTWFRSDTNNNEILVRIQQLANSNLHVEVYDTTGSDSEIQLSASETPVGEWTHVLLTYDGTTRAYIDGALAGTSGTTLSGATRSGSPDEMHLSQWGSSGADGAIDDFRIYNRALTENEIAALAASRGTMQYCNGSEWVAIGPDICDRPGVTPGTLCGDSSIFAGLFDYGSGNEKLFVTDVNQSSATAWATAEGNNDIGPDSSADGRANHANIQNPLSSLPAMHLCENLNRHGHSDWYLPAIDETGLLYDNQSAINSNASEDFNMVNYWSSTEDGGNEARARNFGSGITGSGGGKTTAIDVRCVRRD